MLTIAAQSTGFAGPANIARVQQRSASACMQYTEGGFLDLCTKGRAGTYCQLPDPSLDHLPPS